MEDYKKLWRLFCYFLLFVNFSLLLFLYGITKETKMETKRVICAALATLLLGVTIEAGAVNLAPVLGKMNNGVIFANAAPQQQAEARKLAEKLSGTYAEGGNATPDLVNAFHAALLDTGMDENELAFELINWKLSNRDADNCRLSADVDYSNIKAVRSSKTKLQSAANQISQRDAWYRRIRERAVVRSIERLRQVDTVLIKTLTQLNADINAINSNGKTLREQLGIKIQRVNQAIVDVQKIDTNVDFDGFLENERIAANNRATDLSRILPANYMGYRPAIKSGQDHGQEFYIVHAAETTKSLLITSIQVHVASLLNEVSLFAQSTQATQDDLKLLYYEIGCMVYNNVKVTHADPKSEFNNYGLPNRILGQFANETKFQWELYWSLPSEITDRATGDRKGEYKIPQPSENIPANMRRSTLKIPRTCGADEETRRANPGWGLGGIDDNIW
jgi:hypothetical protein